MKRKGDTHETLSLVFQREGVPPIMVTDDPKEQTKGEFWRKLKEADCHPQVTEPYSLWQQAAESCIRELKRGSSQKMIKSKSPKCLWDHCPELEAYVRSCMSNYIYMTAGQVTETIMTGNTAVISHIAEFGWYDLWQWTLVPWWQAYPGALPRTCHWHWIGTDGQYPLIKWCVCL